MRIYSFGRETRRTHLLSSILHLPTFRLASICFWPSILALLSMLLIFPLINLMTPKVCQEALFSMEPDFQLSQDASDAIRSQSYHQQCSPYITHSHRMVMSLGPHRGIRLSRQCPIKALWRLSSAFAMWLMILPQVKSSGQQVSQSIVSKKILNLKPLSCTGDITPTYDTHWKSGTFSINFPSPAWNSFRNLPYPWWHSDFNKFKTFRVLPAYQTDSW